MRPPSTSSGVQPVILCLGLLSCSESTTERASPWESTSAEALAPLSQPARLGIAPETALPGAELTLTARVPQADDRRSELSVDLEMDAEEVDRALMLRSEGDALIGSIVLNAPAAEGDHLFSIHGALGSSRIEAHAAVNISSGARCGEGEILEAGRCVARVDGHHIKVERGISVNHRSAGRGRLGHMIHPRSARRYGDVIVACMTDAIGLIPVAELPIIDEPIDSAAERLRANLVETRLERNRITVSEHLLVFPERGIAVLSSRGADNRARGGLSSWRLPPLDSRPLAPPEHISSMTGGRGFGDMVRVGDRIFAIHHPNGIASVRLLENGRLRLDGDLDLPAMRGASTVAYDGTHLLVAGATDAHEVSLYGGTMHVLELKEPGMPIVLSSAHTTGTPRGIAILDDEMVAVANGALGIDLFDLGSPAAPQLIANVHTPGSAMGLSFEGGYLLVADWDNIRLYDASVRGCLRLLDAIDGFHPSYLAAGGGLHENGLTAANFVHLENGRFVAAELDVLLTGEIRRGAGAPRLVVHDRGHRLPREAHDEETITIRVSNGGRHQLDLEQPFDRKKDTAGSWCVPPGESALLTLKVAEENVVRTGANSSVILHSNDPENATPRILLIPSTVYQVGDPVPNFRLPMINICPDGSCPERLDCFDLDEEVAKGRPILLAAFASW